MIRPATLATQITDFVTERTAAIIDRFFPDLEVSGFFGGYPILASGRANLAYLLTYLWQLGVIEVAGYPIPRAIGLAIKGIDGSRTETFYSYRVAEALLSFGPFKGNPILADFSPAERENIAQACDSSHIFMQYGKPLGGRPNNYWAVLARCEYDRQQLGVLPDTTILDSAVEQVRGLISNNPLGFFDDSGELEGRYDIYSPDVHLFLEPLWSLLGEDRIRHNLQQHVHLLEDIAMENGASIVWGRSVGALSICMTMELASLALRLGLQSDTGHMLGLVQNAFETFKGWFVDDLINAHRHKMTYHYRGPFRLLEMSLDNLAKLGYTALQLRLAQGQLPEAVEVGELFPKRDKLITLHADGPAVWMFRNDHLAFQLPLVNGRGADYAPWFRSPGLFEVPVDTNLICGLPRIVKDGEEFSSTGLPAEVTKTVNGISLVYRDFPHLNANDDVGRLPGSRVARYVVDRDRIRAEEHWTFEATPDAVGFHIPEGDRRPLRLSIEANGLYRQHTIAVDGMPAWRSFWGEFRHLHEVNFPPQPEISFRYTLKPILQVTSIPGDHDYVRSLYDAMPEGTIVERPLTHVRPLGDMDVERLLGQSDILHIHWPEHLFHSDGTNPEDFDRRLLAFVEDVGRSPTKVVWTLHNRRPHRGDAERNLQLYRAWASVADAAIHHSHWGMELIRSELPFKPSAKHVVIPHGHFGAIMPRLKSREEIEGELGLSPCTMRFGVLGRPQKEKQVDLILRAFHAAARPDQQLLVNAITEDMDIPDDPRIVICYGHKLGLLKRELFARLVQVCDALISAHTGPTYLTSGIVADGVGLGLSVLVLEWPFFQEILGDAAYYYDGSEAGLTRLFESITPEDIEAGKQAMAALQDRYAWPRLAETTLALFEELGCALR